MKITRGKLKEVIFEEVQKFVESLQEDILKEGQISSKDVVIDNRDKKESLFDIKELNAIDDKMIRGTAKKIYMSGKRIGKNSNDIIKEIINTLKDSDKINEDIENLLKGIK